jgi:hypothetical protein
MLQYAACFLPQVQVVCLTPQPQQAQQEGGQAPADGAVLLGFRAVEQVAPHKTVPMSQEKQHLPASSSEMAGGTETGDASSEAALAHGIHWEIMNFHELSMIS